MRKFYPVLVSIIFSFFCLSCAGQKDKHDLGVMFYNVENIFDTIDSPTTIDEEYTPGSEKNWNTEKYFIKLNHIAEVIAHSGDDFPAIVGLCEVENKLVVDDLTNAVALRDANYLIVHFDSPDERGIDVALLYRKDFFSIEETKPIRVQLPEDNGGATRDILYVQAISKKSKTTVHLFVNHWPSRSEGAEKTSMCRAIAAEVLRMQVDSLNALYTDPLIIIMGDFNDTPSDNSIQNILNAKQYGTGDCAECLVNLLTDLEKKKDGSYFYSGSWQILDQFIVSASMLTNNKLQYKPNSVQFIRNDFQLYFSDKNGYLPYRTYVGPKYYGGYSDHLPVYMELQWK